MQGLKVIKIIVSLTIRLEKVNAAFQHPLSLSDIEVTEKKTGKITLKTMSKRKEKARLGSL